MKKSFILLGLLAWAAVVCAQEKTVFDGNDLLEVLRQYNPSVLQNAAQDSSYGKILQELVQNYSAPRTEQNGYELIALAKNFNNSLLLQALKMQYLRARTLQQVSGIETPTLKRDMRHNLQVVLEDIYQNSLAVKKMQLANEKKQLKALRKDNTLSEAEKQTAQQQLAGQIRQTKQEIRYLKKDAKSKIAATAEDYLQKTEAEFLAAQPGATAAEESSSRDVKANHKKPVAE